MSLSVVVLTKNEEARIGRCVRSLAPLPRGTKLLVIDSFSEDGTLNEVRKVWQEIGGLESDLNVMVEAWPGFTDARNRSLERVRTPWVFWLDADEWIEADLARELSALEKLPAEVVICRMARRNRFLGREIRHGGWAPDVKSRLARTEGVRWKGGPRGADVHEDLVALGAGGSLRLKGAIGHEPFRDEAEQRETNVRYSGLLAGGLAETWRARGRTRPPTKVFVALRVGWKFFENYLWKGGFLDGRPGLLLALGSAWSLRERYRKAARLFKETSR